MGWLALAFDLAYGTYGGAGAATGEAHSSSDLDNIAGRDAIADPVPNVSAQA